MNKQQVILYSAIALLFLSLIGTGIFYSSNRTLKSELSNQTLSAQQMMDEKSRLDKELLAAKGTVNELEAAKQNLQNMLDEASKLQGTKDPADMERLRKANASIKTLREQIAEMTRMKTDAENIAAAEKKKMQSEINTLNASLTSLKNENKDLAANLELLRAVNADNFCMIADKKNQKLTAKASRTNRIKVSFEMPDGADTDIKFTIIKPDGTKLSGADDGIAFNVTDNETERVTASATDVSAAKLTKKIEMSYKPKQKLKAGDYLIQMTNKDKHVAYCRVKLR
ncbi:MAG TPA: hypothetical protein VEY71_01280 [Chitinophagales bacterium]|nr:hypothetical protein [Chitinophagales bacterium]